ncbi:MAG: hypothetical protein PHS60_06945 [Zavarzinia sp.]|nr:hypothetical protein [Zavarzinia sp.]
MIVSTVDAPPLDRSRARSGQRLAIWCRAGFALLFCLFGTPVLAQYQERPEDGQARARYNLRPPVDPLANLRTYCRDRVPVGWWCSDPYRLSHGFRIVVTVPSRWRGNPSGAMLNFCPPRGDPVWEDVPLIEFQSRDETNKQLGAPITCRPQ